MKIYNILDILFFIVLCIIYYYLLQIEDEKTCNCITNNQIRFFHNFMKFTVIVLIVTQIVMQNIVKFHIFIKQLFVLLNLLLLGFNMTFYIKYVFLLDENKCSCLINNPLLNTLMKISTPIPIIILILILAILTHYVVLKGLKKYEIYLNTGMFAFLLGNIGLGLSGILNYEESPVTSSPQIKN